jgi:NAD(P)-dependent dehydrogenase (short-subunit alcohol dehydrogenase family)
VLLLPESARAADNGGAIYVPAAGSMAGKTVLITGANTGLGLESALRLRRAGATVVVTARSDAKVAQTVAKLEADPAAAAAGAGGKVVGVELDLADLASVKGFPDRLAAATSKTQAVDVLLNNAGVMAIPERLATADGFERTVGVNHLGHFALTGALLPFLERAPNGFRVVTVSSDAHRFATKKQVAGALEAGTLEEVGKYSAWGAYGLSKATNVLFTEELQQRIEAKGLKGSAVALHPGAVQTDLPRYIIGGAGAGDVRMSETAPPPTGLGKAFKEGLLDKVVLPIERGANTQVFLSSGGDSGGDLAAKPKALYFDDSMTPAKPNDAASDPALAQKLWDVSEKLTGVKFL